jgi:hypothetical protein
MLSYAIRREWAVIRILSLLLRQHRWLLPGIVILGLLSSALEGFSLIGLQGSVGAVTEFERAKVPIPRSLLADNQIHHTLENNLSRSAP